MSDQKKSLEDKWATWVICLSIATFLICGLAIGLLNIKRSAPIIQHKIVFATDSLGQDVYSRSQVDSLILVIQSQERALSHKYQYMFEEREKEESSRTLITFIVGAIISVCGFFGYKSFKDIKDHGEKIAEAKAIETAQKTIAEQLPEMMKDEMTKIYKGQSLDVIKQSITHDLTTMLESYIDDALAGKVEEMNREILEVAQDQASPGPSDENHTGTTETADEDLSLFLQP